MSFCSRICRGPFWGALLALGVFIITLFFAGFYIYHALAWHSIAKKLKHKAPWLAWIPFANFVLILQLGGFHWAWVFLILVPIFGWIALFILGIIATWKTFKRRKQPGWFSLAPIIPQIGWILYLIAIGIVAWSKKK
jgi:uncharacterized membrane protein YhaH (DUF805 family)